MLSVAVYPRYITFKNGSKLTTKKRTVRLDTTIEEIAIDVTREFKAMMMEIEAYVLNSREIVGASFVDLDTLLGAK